MKSQLFAFACVSLFIMSSLAMGATDVTEPNATLTVSLGTLSSPYTWFDDVLVTATVTLSGSPAMGCEVVATCTLNPSETSVLRDDGISPDAVASNGVYTGYYRIGGANGSAMVAKTGNRITVTATRPGDSGSAQTAQFTTFAAKRWTGVTTTGLGTEPDSHDLYTNFIPTRNGEGWHHVIQDYGITSASNKNGALIRVPIFPKENTITNLTVIGGTEAKAVDNVIQFKANLVSGATARFTIGFDSPSDLAASYIDKYNTAHIGLREFRNGYIVWNAHVSQAIFGSPNLSTLNPQSHGVGVSAGMQVLEKSSGLMRSIDCMERVGIVYDGSLYYSGGSYTYNIKWQDQVDNSWMISSDLSQMSFRIPSLGTYCDGNLAIDKTLQFYSDEHYIRQNYTIENVDSVPHTATLVWGREQWMYGDTTMTNTSDRGYVGTDPTLYGSGNRIPGSAMTEKFFGAVDTGTYFSLAMIFRSNSTYDLPTYAYFLRDAPLAASLGVYPINYPPTEPNDGSTFFEKQFGAIPAGGKAYSEFCMWGGYGTSAADLQSMVAADTQEITYRPEFNTELHAGWNLLSIPLELADTSVETVLSSISAHWDVVKFYHPETKSWMSHRQGASANTLDSIDLTMGFWVHTSSACTLTVSGNQPATTAMALQAGWNLVGYPSATERTASDALAGIDCLLEVFDSGSPYLISVADASHIMKPGEGYWIKVASDTVWNLNW